MPRILFAWEMGQNYGHLSSVLPLARRLAARGAEIYLALQNPLALTELDAQAANIFTVLPAPHLNPRLGPPLPRGVTPLNYAQDIAPCGYRRAEELTTLIQCWQNLYDLVMPDLLVANAAPTALLATRGTKIATAAVGVGYDLPPVQRPLPPLRGPLPADEMAALARAEDEICATINAALAVLHLPLVDSVAASLNAHHRFLLTLPELDHYGARPHTSYAGPLASEETGDRPQWPAPAEGAASGPRLFVYIRPNHPLFAALMQSLRTLGWPSLVVAPGLSDSAIRELSGAQLRITPRPVRYGTTMDVTDIVINTGSHGTVSAAFLAGKPQLALPQQIEQLMLARRVVEMGVGLLVHPNGAPPHLEQALRELAANPSFVNQARAQAARYAPFDSAAQADRIAQQLYAVAAQGDGG